ncbi:hypothetical protein [Leptospira santarosai]|uniref:hypothetical protein n=1 Tax=Leptospira santarosai TaxID=28183 RepID=UPI00035CDD13|nr:hypothetical protein [Leptospira santarosai]
MKTLLNLILGFFLVFNQCLIAEKDERIFYHWRQKPEVPNGWILIDKEQITFSKKYQYLILCHDGNTILFLLAGSNSLNEFEYQIVDSIPKSKVDKYIAETTKVKSKLVIQVKGFWFNFGPHESEPIMSYKWIAEKESFETWYFSQ